MFPNHIRSVFAQRHVDLWEWEESIRPSERPRPFVALWPRGGAKSTTAELVAVRVGCKERKARRYIWYVSSTQDKADKHVENINALLESDTTAKYDPDLAERAVGKYGASKGWRRERLRTRSGLTIDALGLDVGVRGAKVEDQRPDMIILDDVDEKTDSFAVTLKKIDTITTTVLPAGSNDCAILFIQNLIHPDSIASRLSDGRADFIADRILSGPFPAVDSLTYEQQEGRYIITGGEATWAGQSLEVCQNQMTTWGFSAFMQESQHDVERGGGIWENIEFQHVEYEKLPVFVRSAVWVDPAVTTTDQSDSMGISAGGLADNGKIYGVYWWENITTPEDAIERAIKKAIEIKALTVGIETDQGGDTWRSVFTIALANVQRDLKAKLPDTEYTAIQWPRFDYDKAGAGYGSKVERNSRMLTDYENGRIIHMIGTHTIIERALRRFPNKPLDVADSMFWLWNDLHISAAPLNTQQTQPSKWHEAFGDEPQERSKWRM